MKWWNTVCMALLLSIAGLSAVYAQNAGEGNGSVSPFYGSFSTEIPIAVPQYHDLEPKLKLVYGSGGRNSWIGVGWRLSGLSFIERSLPGGGAPHYDSSDSFFMDGVELLPCTSQGGTHCTRIQNYARIEQDTGGNRWYVTGTNGNVATYDPVFNTAEGTFRWMLTNVTDNHGNSVNYTYWPDALNDVYLDKITYNGAEIIFHREWRSDPVFYATGGSMLGRTNYRLKAIEVRNAGSMVRAYALQHQISYNTKEATLISVQQYGNDATVNAGWVSGANYLPPMQMTYQIPFNDLDLPVYADNDFPQLFDGSKKSFHSTPHYNSSGDYNGDGIDDYMWIPDNGDNRWVIAYGSANGFIMPNYSTPALPATLSSGHTTRNGNAAYHRWGDFNADGKTDFMWVPSNGDGRWLIAYANGNGFDLPDYNFPVIANKFDGVYTGRNDDDRHNRVGDFNGDGKDDFMWLPENGDGRFVIAYANTAGDGFIMPNYFAPALPNTIDGKYNRHSNGDRMRSGDFNGDGRQDYMWMPSNGDGRWLIAYADDTGFVLPSYATPQIPSLFDGVYKAWHATGRHMTNSDFNGDGKTDYMWRPDNGDGRWIIAYSTGYGFEYTGYDPWPALPKEIDGYNTWGSGAGYQQFGDFNGDGKTDYMWRPSDGDGRWIGAFATSYGFTTPTYFTYEMANNFDGTYKSWHSNANYHRVGDFNGDGKKDFMWRPNNGDGRWMTATAVATITDYLSTINNGMGGVSTITYTPSSAWNNSYLPTGLRLQTVSRLSTDDGLGNVSTTDYSYEGGLWSAGERRFLGFRKVTSVLDAQGNYTETWYLQQEGSISKPEYTYFKDNQGNIYSYSFYQYSYNASPPYTSLLTDRWDYECNGTPDCRRALTQLGYDQYGNVTHTYEHGDYDVFGDERTNVRGYVPNMTDYIVGLPAYENTYAGIGVGGQLMNQVLYYYDNNPTHNQLPPTKGNVTQIDRWDSNTGGYVTSYMGYDLWGNLTSEIDERGKTASTVFDPVYRVFPLEATNALGHTTYRSWDYVMGLETSTTDANGHTTSVLYDELGRRDTITWPDSNVSQFDYYYLGLPGYQYYQETKPDGTADGLWTRTYQDGLVRVIKVVREGGITKDTEYSGSSDRISRETLPYLTGGIQRWINYSYDGAGRVRTTTWPDGKFAEVIYGMDASDKPFAANYDEEGNERIIWRSVDGNLLEVQETNGTETYATTYEYDALGRAISITDDQSNVSSFIWDSFGRKQSSTEPNMGTWTYDYDDAGNLISRIDARAREVTYTYDDLNRVKTKTYPNGGVTTWYYDERGYGSSTGRLTRVTYPGGSEEHHWSNRGQEIKTVRCVDSACRTFDRTYDALGRLDTLTYPDGEVVTYGYDDTGRLQTVSNYVTDMQWTPAGSLLSSTYANGTTNTFDYDADRLWMTDAEVTAGANTLYQASYNYYDSARVSSITSTTNPLLNLNFTYDDLGRLKTVTGGQTQSFDYDSIGNMIYNSAKGTYTYGSAKPHAVTAAGNKSYGYDANGNMIDRNGYNVVWDAENRMTKIDKIKAINPLPKTQVVVIDPQPIATNVKFKYDFRHNRIRKQDEVVTRYFGNLVTQIDGSDTQYVFAGGIRVARKDNSGTFWYHADHLGSTRLVTTSVATVAKSYDYAAFGKIVSETGRGTNSIGFNGHETDADCGLVYMKARYYDPDLGRFISPDSIVPDPFNPQALNRYSFVYNNPISNTDPSGHAPVAAAIISATAISATAGTVISVTAWIGAGLSVAGYFLEDPVLSSIGGVLLGFAGGYVGPGPVTGLAGGIIGGTVAAATSPLSPLDPGTKRAIGWAFSTYGASAEGFQSAVEGALHAAAKSAAQQGVSWLEGQLGLDPGELNEALTMLSFVGNEAFGSRLYSFKHAEHIAGMTQREHSTLGFIFADIPDVLLGFQGLPTATAFEYLTSGNKEVPLVGHSLGALDANNLGGAGLAGDDVTAISLPFFAAGAPGVQIINSNQDIINGSYLGNLLSPYSKNETLGWGEHSTYKDLGQFGYHNN